MLDFDDLLFTCRDVLRAYPWVRAAAGRALFPDTRRRISGHGPRAGRDHVSALRYRGRCARTGTSDALKPGHLFLVGDPKQAIYRFRGADLATYLTVRRAIEEQFPDNILRGHGQFPIAWPNSGPRQPLLRGEACRRKRPVMWPSKAPVLRRSTAFPASQRCPSNCRPTLESTAPGTKKLA